MFHALYPLIHTHLPLRQTDGGLQAGQQPPPPLQASFLASGDLATRVKSSSFPSEQGTREIISPTD